MLLWLMTFDPDHCLRGLNSPICPLEVADSLSAQQVVSGPYVPPLT